MDRAIDIFVSHARADHRWFEQESLIPQLSRWLEVHEHANVWYDQKRLVAGDEWRCEIEAAINRAHIAILLVSRDFLTSNFIREEELPRIEQRFRGNTLVVIPILVGHCEWRKIPFLDAPQMLPGGPTPLIEFVERPRDWDRVVNDIIKQVAKQVQGVRKRFLEVPPRGAETAATRRSTSGGGVDRQTVLPPPRAGGLRHRLSPGVISAVAVALVVVLAVLWLRWPGSPGVSTLGGEGELQANADVLDINAAAFVRKGTEFFLDTRAGAIPGLPPGDGADLRGYTLEMQFSGADGSLGQLWLKDPEWKNVYSMAQRMSSHEPLRFTPGVDACDVCDFGDFSRVFGIGANIFDGIDGVTITSARLIRGTGTGSLRSPDGRYEATKTGAGDDIHYQVRSVATGRTVLATRAQFERANVVKAAAFSPDGMEFAAGYHYGHVGGYTWVGVWSVESGQLLRTQRKKGWTTEVSWVFEGQPREVKR